MFDTILLNAFTVLLISYVIARNSRLADPRVSLTRYLFGGNNQILAVSSNVGSLLSIAIVVNIYYVGLFGYGLITLASLTAGLVFAYLALYFGVRRIVRRGVFPRLKHSTYAEVLTTLGTRRHAFMNCLFLIQYAIVIVSEFAVLNALVSALFPSSLAGPVVATVVGILCATYTTVGGYSGVLRTDLFQLLVFFSGCIYITIRSETSAVDLVLTELSDKNFVWTDTLPPLTFAIMTAVAFFAFPDVWIRNISSLNVKRDSRVLWIAVSLILLLVLMGPITTVALHALSVQDGFDMRYDVPRTHQQVMSVFQASAILRHDPFALWFVIASVLCVFVTTIDTWLIGTMQHLRLLKLKHATELISLTPFVIVLASVAISTLVRDKIILVVGLFVFPFLFFNMLCFLLQVFPSIKRDHSWIDVSVALLSGILLTATLIWLNFETLEEVPYAVILYSGVAVLAVFAAGVLIRAIARLRMPGARAK